MLPIPADKFVMVEIGSNTQNTLDQTMLPNNPETFVLTFEPLLDKYGTLLSRNSAPDRASQLGFHHERGIALPLAVASGEPFATRDFHVHAVDGCSSLLHGAPTSCAEIVETRRVATVPLSHVLEAWLGGRRVDYLKIDAQGADLDILESAGDLLKNIHSVSVEVPSDDALRKYQGELGCTDALRELDRRFGLKPVGAKRMHEARFTRVGHDSTTVCFSGVEALEVLLCLSPRCVLDTLKPGDTIPGVKRP